MPNDINHGWPPERLYRLLDSLGGITINRLAAIVCPQIGVRRLTVYGWFKRPDVPHPSLVAAAPILEKLEREGHQEPGEWAGKDVKRLRLRYGLSKPQFARGVGITASTVYQLESGRRTAHIETRRLLDKFKQNPVLPKKRVPKFPPERVQGIRETLGLNYQDFGELIKVFPGHITRYELPESHPRHRYPSPRVERNLEAIERRLKRQGLPKAS